MKKIIMRYLKYQLKKNQWGNRLLLSREVNKKIIEKKDEFHVDCKKYGFKAEETTPIKKLKKKLIKSRDNRDTCNIIGSGKSALKAIENYNPKEAYFTCNFGGLLDIDFDLYVNEVGTSKSEDMRILEVSELIKKVILERKHKTKNLIFKNIWQGNISKQYLDKNYSNYTLIRDILLPEQSKLQNEEELDILFGKMFNSKHFFVLQVHTTILTLVQFAVWSGYKTINIYGLEGKGSHFFHYNHDFKNQRLVEIIREHLPAVDDEHIHKTGFKARKLIKPMANFLKKKFKTELNLMN